VGGKAASRGASSWKAVNPEAVSRKPNNAHRQIERNARESGPINLVPGLTLGCRQLTVENCNLFIGDQISAEAKQSAITDGFHATISRMSYQGHLSNVMVKKKPHGCIGSGSAVSTSYGQSALSDLSAPKRFKMS
jgi:hypothetical protein